MQSNPARDPEPPTSPNMTAVYWYVILTQVVVLTFLWSFNWWFTR